MPQLDKMNWFFILTLLVVSISFLLVIFIKRNFYSWRKVLLLKLLTKFNISNLTKKTLLISFLSLQSFFLLNRKTLFSDINLIKTPLFSNTVKNFEHEVYKKL
jgi:hypothetical protein